MQKIALSLLLLLSPFFLINAQDTLSIIIAGDIMGHDTQINAAKRGNTYEYDTTFYYIKPILENHDIAIGNLEVILGVTPYKGYPQFSSPAELGSALKNAGFDIIVTANNHTCDRGKKGIENTLLILDTLGFTRTGSFYNQEEKDEVYPLSFHKKGFHLGLLNYTYGTNGLPVPPPNRVNYLDMELMQKDFKKLDSMNVDAKIAITHWGAEYLNYPDAYQKKYAKFLHDGGINYVIGSHPHVVQPAYYDKDKEELTVYSLGNFVSNQRALPKDGGMMLKLDLVKDSIGEVKIAQVGYVLTWVYAPIIDNQKYFFVLPASQYENNEAFFASKADYDKMHNYLNHARKLLNENNLNVPEYKWNEEAKKWEFVIE